MRNNNCVIIREYNGKFIKILQYIAVKIGDDPLLATSVYDINGLTM